MNPGSKYSGLVNIEYPKIYYFSYSILYHPASHYLPPHGSQSGEAVILPKIFTLLDQLFTGKIRIRLLTKLLQNLVIF